MAALPLSPRILVLSCYLQCLVWQQWAHCLGQQPSTVLAPGHVWWPVTWCPSRSSPYTCTQRWLYWCLVTSWWVPGWDAGRRLGPLCSWRSHLKWHTCYPTERSVNSRETVDEKRWPGIWPGDSRWDVNNYITTYCKC